MQSKQLKNFLMTNPERIHRLLSTAGFHKITQRCNEIRCALPTMDNPTGVMIKLNEALYTALFELGYTGDLFGALEVVLQKEFKEVMSYIHSLFGIATSDKGDVFTDPLKELRQLSGMNLSNSTSQNRLYDESFLNRFVLGVPKPLLEEGISPSVIREFKIGYDPEQSRIIFPHFDWEHDRKLVGVKGRVTEDSEVIKELGIPKYWNYIDGYRKSLNLYGFYLAKKQLSNTRKLIIFESEKSVLKEFTYEKGYGSSVALGGHSISSRQVDFILKHTPTDCEIILAFDKDVMTKPEEGEEYIKNEAIKFRPFRRVSYILDTHSLLGEKDSPIDKNYKTWKYLLKWRRKIALN